MPDTMQQQPHFGMREVCTRLAPPPLALILGGGSEAFHRHLFENREKRSAAESGAAEEWSRELQEQQRQQQDRELRVQYWRGVFLDRFFALEHNLGVVLAAHFEVAAAKWDEWEHWMLGRVPFNQKMQLVQRVLNSRGITDQFLDLYAHLEQLNRFRNVLAHGMIEPMDDAGSVSFLYFQQGVFEAQKFRVIDLYLHVLRLTSLLWQVDKLNCVIVGREWEFAGAEDEPLEVVRRLEAAKPGRCPECATPRAGLVYAPAPDAWQAPDFTGQDTVYAACTNSNCTRYEPKYDPDVSAAS